MHNAVDHFEPIANWALEEALKSMCFNNEVAATTSTIAHRAVNNLWKAFHKTDSVPPDGSFYYGMLYKRLNDILTNSPHREPMHTVLAEGWYYLEDYNFLNNPMKVDRTTLVEGGIPAHIIPSFGLIYTNDDTPMRRGLQFLVDYFGIFRAYQLNTAGILQPLLTFVATASMGQDHDFFGRSDVHDAVNERVVLEALSMMKPILCLDLAIEVIIEEYFHGLPTHQHLSEKIKRQITETT